jgi:hypothetical protein
MSVSQTPGHAGMFQSKEIYFSNNLLPVKILLWTRIKMYAKDYYSFGNNNNNNKNPPQI